MGKQTTPELAIRPGQHWMIGQEKRSPSLFSMVDQAPVEVWIGVEGLIL